MPETTTPTTVRLPVGLKARALALADRTDRPLASLIRVALADYLDRHPERKDRANG